MKAYINFLKVNNRFLRSGVLYTYPVNRNNYKINFHHFSKGADYHVVDELSFKFIQGLFPRKWLFIILKVTFANETVAVIPCVLERKRGHYQNSLINTVAVAIS